MSAVLLQRVKKHIIDDGGFFSEHRLKYYKWTDADLNGTGQVVLLRMTGTSGLVSTPAQFHDVSLFALSGPSSVLATDNTMLEVLRYLREDFADTGVFNMFPIGGYTGPSYLENDRAMFEIVIRCGVEDH